MTRNPYTYKVDLNSLSLSNEPFEDYLGGTRLRQYPDILSVYNAFSTFMCNISLNRFILCNGGENAVKNTLLALKPKSLMYSVPTWGMIDVFCEALDIKPLRKNLEFNSLLNCVQEQVPLDETKGVDCFYDCYKYNNLIGYTSNLNYNYTLAKYNILDVSYCTLQEIQSLIKKNYRSTIIVGSFDKMFGVGLRLGFAIYPEHLNEQFQLQREQFLNYEACIFLKWLESKSAKSLDNYIQNKLISRLEIFIKYIPLIPVSVNFNFITYKSALEYNVNKRIFKIDNQYFTRFNYPFNKQQTKDLQECLKK